MKTLNTRITEYPIEDIFLKRHSPRTMLGESISKEDAKNPAIENHWKK